jgi:hypothetical protein
MGDQKINHFDERYRLQHLTFDNLLNLKHPIAFYPFEAI